MERRGRRIVAFEKLSIALHVWRLFLGVRVDLRRWSLPMVVDGLKDPPRSVSGHGWSLDDSGGSSSRVLRIGPWRARCLHTSLVLFRLLQRTRRPAGARHRPTP